MEVGLEEAGVAFGGEEEMELFADGASEVFGSGDDADGGVGGVVKDGEGVAGDVGAVAGEGGVLAGFVVAVGTGNEDGAVVVVGELAEVVPELVEVNRLGFAIRGDPLTPGPSPRWGEGSSLMGFAVSRIPLTPGPSPRWGEGRKKFFEGIDEEELGVVLGESGFEEIVQMFSYWCIFACITGKVEALEVSVVGLVFFEVFDEEVALVGAGEDEDGFGGLVGELGGDVG